MKTKIAFVAAMTLMTLSLPTMARNDRLMMPIKDALETPDAKAKLDPNIKLFFGSQKSPKPSSTLGTFTSHKKSNFANKSDKAGCEWVFLSAAIALQERARAEGGNAVVNIVSVYGREEVKSDTEYACSAGKLMGGVNLSGQVVKLP